MNKKKKKLLPLGCPSWDAYRAFEKLREEEIKARLEFLFPKKTKRRSGTK